MAIDVREFRVERSEMGVKWRFTVSHNALSIIGQSDLVTSTPKTLSAIADKLASEAKTSVQMSRRSDPPEHRSVRKSCEALLKVLRIPLGVFAQDIEEQKATVRAYFKKSLSNEDDRNRLRSKVREWVLAMWFCLPPDALTKCTQKYLGQVSKDTKLRSQDPDPQTQFYVYRLGGETPDDTNQQRNDTASLLLIDINFTMEDKFVSESLLWSQGHTDPNSVRSFCSAYIHECAYMHGMTLENETHRELLEQVVVAVRSQLFYKTLLLKHSSILLNFSTMQVLPDAREYLVPIHLRLADRNGQTIYQDSFEWDILNEANNVQEFATILIDDLELPQHFLSEICYRIRAQIHNELQKKFTMLVRTFKEIHRERENPKLNTQTAAVLKKNAVYSMDVLLPVSEASIQFPSNLYFNNTELHSLLLRNLDILPAEVRQLLESKEKQGLQAIQSKISPAQAQNRLKQTGQTISDNKYLEAVQNPQASYVVWTNSLKEHLK